MRFNTEAIVLAIALHLDDLIAQDRFIHSRYEKKFCRQLSKLQRNLRHRRIPRCALLTPKDSAWRQVYKSGCDQALITMTGLELESIIMF
jgi:hypothetical protein